MTDQLIIDQGKPDANYKKYKTYALKVDPDQDDKATEIKLCNFSRPHMRAFHCSWICFFLAFFIWFSISALLPEVKKSIDGVGKKEIWTSNICSVAGTSIMRFVLGPLCDKYGARILMGIVLMLGSIPTACIGLVQSGASLSIVRLFIGLSGSSFVMCQFWTTSMFTKEVVGTANSLVGGWGNLGGGVTQLVMGGALFPLFKAFGLSADTAWRTVCIVPAVVAFCAGFTVFFISDDCPKGNYKELKRMGAMAEVSASSSFRSGVTNLNTWLLFLHYGSCFGVEITMNNAAALYFTDKFGLSTEAAASVASIFGFMNLFARSIGGFGSDKINSKAGMRGRLIWQMCLLLVEGALIFVFAHTNDLASSIVVLVFFSTVVQAAEGSTYGIVPYVDPPSTGSISGIVGAGGNIGAVAFSIAFRQMDDYIDAFIVMGCIVFVAGLSSVLISIRHHRSILCGEDSEVVKHAWQARTLSNAEADTDDKA